jgi:quercetin dioxygenase-like cupin family protein
MATATTGMKRSFDQPDETRPFAENMGEMKIISVGDHEVGLGTYKPGWQWSKHVKPIAGGDACQADHNGFMISGRMTIRMNNGDEIEIGPGEAFHIPPGHDAWVVGDEPAVLYDFTGTKRYAKPS